MTNMKHVAHASCLCTANVAQVDHTNDMVSADFTYYIYIQPLLCLINYKSWLWLCAFMRPFGVCVCVYRI